MRKVLVEGVYVTLSIVLFRFRVENFRSIKEEQEFSLIASSLQEDISVGVLSNRAVSESVLLSAAIYGPNGSGKTNILKSLDFFVRAITDSQRKWEPKERIPREPFSLDGDWVRRPSRFEMDFIVDGVRYQYGFALDSEAVLSESLAAYPSGKKQIWFKRSGDQFTFGKKFTGENRSIQSLTRTNSLFLSAAAQNNHQQILPLYDWFSNAFEFTTSSKPSKLARAAYWCQTIDEHKRAVQDLFAAADLGIVGFEVKEEDFPIDLKDALSSLKISSSNMPEKWPRVFFQHRGKSGVASFSSDEESSGTVSYFSLLASIVRALRTAGLLCVDELDSSLHPSLVAEIVKVFNDPGRNVFGAQLVFNTHDTNLLTGRILRRDQVWFTEKDSEGATHLYSLTEFKPRKSENLEHGYLQGRYGAIPFLGTPDLLINKGADEPKA